MNQDAEDLAAYIGRTCDGAFERIVGRHSALVFGVAFRMTRNRELAQEITQSVFILLARKARAVRGELLPGWLHKTTHWEVKNALRKEVRGSRLNQQYQQHMDTPEPSAEQWNQVAPLLDDAVAKLPTADKEVVILRYFERLSFGEIAKATGKTEEACKKRAQRSLERLRGLLQKQNVHPSLPALVAMIGVYGLMAAPASAAQITQVALSGAAGASTGAFGASFFKALTFMTTKHVAAIAVAVCAIAGVAIVQQSKDESAGKGLAAAPAPVRPKANPAPAPAKPAAAIDWLSVVRKGSVPSADERQQMTTDELVAALEAVTNLDGISKGTKLLWRAAFIAELSARDPMLVLNRLEADEGRDMWFGLLPAYGVLVKKDINAADAWMKQQLENGLLADTRNGKRFEYNCFETMLLQELKQKDPEAAFQRMLVQPPGVDRADLALELNNRDLAATVSQSLDHYRTTGDPALLQEVMNSFEVESIFSPTMQRSAEEKEKVQRLIDSIPDESVRQAAQERIEKAKQSQLEGVPLRLLEQ